MIGYSSVIRVLTGGENSYSLTFDRYEVVPDDVVERVRHGRCCCVCCKKENQ